MRPEDNWITVRVWFTKTGRARYISHLDLNRCMTRAVQKAKIPLWYTEGFNPHPFLTFALPLSLGIDGVRESMDIRLIASIPKEEMIEKINAGLPSDIRVFDVTEPKQKPGKIHSAAFTITMEPEQGTPEQGAEALEQLLARESIIVPKKTKSGIKDVDIKPFLDLRSLNVEERAVVTQWLLPAGSTQNVNPHLIFDALSRYQNARFYVSIVRTNLFDQDGEVFA
jgi:radical SAM-linked protein